MAAYKLATSLQITSTLPRDAVMINPVINDTLGGGDIQQLCTDWALAVKSWLGWSTTGEIKVKAYECGRPKPNYPAAEAMLNGGTAFPVTKPREIALCLSFYSDYNLPRRRGRLYVPAALINLADTIALRPTTAQMNKVGDLAGALAALGGVDDDWSVWSGVDGTARKVTNWFVDDEWDVQRRRGLRSTTRSSGVTSE
jgi:hypothetical protein